MSVREIILIILSIIIGAVGVFGLVICLKDPTGTQIGMADFLPVLQKRLPFMASLFQDLRFHGVSMLLVAGLPQLVSTILLVCRYPLSLSLVTICGIAIILWCIWEMTIIGVNSISVTCLLAGCVELILGNIK